MEIRNFVALKIIMILVTTYAILVQPVMDSNKELSTYDLIDIEGQSNHGEENNQEETLKDKKINDQFNSTRLNDFIVAGKNTSCYIEPINFDINLEIHIPPPEFL